jgi:hypothetical protein
MVNNSIIINKTNNNLSLQTIDGFLNRYIMFFYMGGVFFTNTPPIMIYLFNYTKYYLEN